MNVVLDTNVLFSAMLSPGRKAYNILQSVSFGDSSLTVIMLLHTEFQPGFAPFIAYSSK